MNKFEKYQKVNTLPIPGRKAKFGTNVKDMIVSMFREKPFYTARQIRNGLTSNIGFSCYSSISTVKRVLRKAGLLGYRARTKQSISQKHMTARLDFANSFKEFDWTKILFLDEKTIKNHYNGRQYVRRPRGQTWNERYVIRMNKTRRFKINLWSYIMPGFNPPLCSWSQLGLFNIQKSIYRIQ